MTIIRKINVSQVGGNDANTNNTDEIRPFGEAAFYLDTNQDQDKLTLMMFDGSRTHLKSKVLSQGVLFGSNADSGDGNGYDTIKLIPDAGLHYNDGSYGNDQYIIVDPTAPNHVHIRAGGTIDNSNADLYLGGELTHVKVSDGYDNVVIRTSTVGEGITPHDWTFGDNGYLTFPDGTESSGQGIWPPVDNGFGITLTRNVELSAVAAVNSGEDVLYIDISENDDISVVNTFWQLNTGTPTAPILTPVTSAITPEPGIYAIVVSGVTFVPGETYTFRSDSIDAVDWVFMPTGELRTSGLGTISHYPGSTSSLKFEVPSGNDIVLRTAGGDTVVTSDGDLQLGGSIITQGIVELTNIGTVTAYTPGVDTFITLRGSISNGVALRATDAELATKDWLFSVDGTLTTPGGISSTNHLNLDADYDTGYSVYIGSNHSTPGMLGGVVIGDTRGGFVDIITEKLLITNTTVPAHSTGAEGDVAGQLAFDSSYIYYCTANYGQLGHRVTGADYLGRTSVNTNAFQLTKTVDTLQITVGDIISDGDGGATSIVNGVTSDENYTYVNTGGLAYSATFPLTFTSTDYVSGGNIWKRVAWSGDTW